MCSKFKSAFWNFLGKKKVFLNIFDPWLVESVDAKPEVYRGLTVYGNEAIHF